MPPCSENTCRALLARDVPAPKLLQRSCPRPRRPTDCCSPVRNSGSLGRSCLEAGPFVVPSEFARSVPPLRERAADIPLLVDYFIDRFGKRAGKKFKTIDRKSLKAFQSYEWPGNVRELQNVIERAVILSEGETVAMEEGWLKRELRGNPKRSGTLHGSLLKQEKEMIEAALAASQGRISGPSGAAAKLGLPSRTLDSKIKRLKINVYRFKTPR